jgi:ligand-binding sensor domain-containing protein
MKPLFNIVVILFLFTTTAAQQSRYFFRKLTVSEGLNDGGVLAIAQDSRGFMWFSTRAGLNRFDGYSVKSYSHIAGDSTSLPTSLSRAMSVDSSGGFLVGLEDGMLEYNEQADRFIPVTALKNTWVLQIEPFNRTTVFLATRKGLVKYNPVTKEANFYRNGNNEILKSRIFSIERQNNYLLLALEKGFYRFDLLTEQLQKIDLPFLKNETITVAEVDADKNYWFALKDKAGLLKVSADLQRHEVYNEYLETGKNTIQNFTSIITDQKGRVWVTTQLQGLLVYNPAINRFERFLHDPLKIWTPSTNLHSTAYCDRNGVIWVAGNNGVNYFNPDRNLFRIIPVFDKDPDIRNRRVARIAAEDKNGKLWFGTIDGVVKFDPLTNEYREWNNREGKTPMIHFNSVRGIFCDDERNQ